MVAMVAEAFVDASPICIGSNVYQTRPIMNIHNQRSRLEWLALKVKFCPTNSSKVYRLSRLVKNWPLQLMGPGGAVGSMKKRTSLVMVATFPSGLVQEERFTCDNQRTDKRFILDAHKDDYSYGEELETTDKCDELKVHFLEETDEEVLSKRILSLSRANRVRSALELCMSVELSGLQLSIHAYNSLISCLLRNGQVGHALKVFRKLEERGLTSGHTFSLILKSVSVVQGCDSALKLFLEWEERGLARKHFDPVVHNTIISVCARENNWVQMEIFWRLLKEHGHIGTKVTYAVLVCTFVRCGQTELALDAFHEMFQNKIEPGEDTLKALLGACAKEGKWEVALNMLNHMLKLGHRGNAVAYNAVINCLGKAGKVEHAFRVYNLMKSSGFEADSYTWHALLSALYKGGRYADALQVFEYIRREKRLEVNNYLYNVALLSCKKLGLWERALQLLSRMEDCGMPISTASYNHVIGACEASRKPEVALQVYTHMTNGSCEPDIFTYLSLIRACIWGSLWAEASDILSHVGPNASIYNTLIQGMCLRGQSKLAKKMYRRMQSYGLKPDGKTRAFMLQHMSND